jgi:ABC-type sugar transport system substrate-binding protein
MVTPLRNFPFYVNHDQKAFLAWGKARNVKVSILGPEEWDIAGQIAVIEQVIGTRPTGLLINGTDQAIASAINKAVDAGIPTVVYDSDIPRSKRHCFLGTDWYEIGRLQGEALVRLTGGRGKIAYLGIPGLSNQEAGFRGLLDVLKKHPAMQPLGPYDEKSNAEVAAKQTADLLAAHPDLAGLACFTAAAAPGASVAIREAGKIGKVKVTTVNYEPEMLQLLRDGAIDYCVGQKRETFTWYGAQFLYDLAHGTNAITSNDARAGVAAVPFSVSPGVFEVTRENVGLFENR